MPLVHVRTRNQPEPLLRAKLIPPAKNQQRRVKSGINTSDCGPVNAIDVMGNEHNMSAESPKTTRALEVVRANLVESGIFRLDHYHDEE